MSKTALQLVNSVLTRLREDTVSNFSDDYTALILEFVNEVHREVQSKHQWEALKKDIQFSTVASQQRYILSGTTDDVYGDVISGGDTITTDSSLVFLNDPYTGKQKAAAWGFTADSVTNGTGYPLVWVPKEQGQSLRYREQTSSQNRPERFYTYVSRENDTDMNSLYFLDVPSETVRVLMTWYVPRADLEDTTDVVVIPHMPIILGAFAKALDERGEELGPAVGTAYQKYYEALDAAIFQDTGDETQVAVPE
jgi:hypothetical protein